MRHSLASLGEVPSAEKLTVWFETLLSVQRAAVGSAEFYQETARAIVDLVGLDRGLVLLREAAGWRIAAGWAKDQTTGLSFSRSVLSRVVEQGRTFFGTPQSANARASLENVEAVVGSPIFGSDGTVVGVVYGSRDWGQEMSRVGIQPLEAQVVQLLASSVSAGLIRLEMQQRLQQVEQLAAVGQAIAYIVHDLRGPLGNVRQLLEMRRAGPQEGLGQEEQLDLIDQSLSVALDLLNDSFEFCRGNVRVQPIRGTFSDLLGKHLRLLRMDLQMLGVALEVNVPAELQVALDPERMARVLRNLARNAGEALQGRADAVVTIGAQQVAAGVELYVADNGPGIPCRGSRQAVSALQHVRKTRWNRIRTGDCQAIGRSPSRADLGGLQRAGNAVHDRSASARRRCQGRRYGGRASVGPDGHFRPASPPPSCHAACCWPRTGRSTSV